MTKVMGWFFGWFVATLFWGTLAWFANRIFYGTWDWWNTIRWWFIIVLLVYLVKQLFTAPDPRFFHNIHGHIGPF